MVRQGLISLFDDKENLVGKLAEGDVYVTGCGNADMSLVGRGVVTEDCLVYTLDCDGLAQLRQASEAFDQWFAQTSNERLKAALETLRQTRECGSEIMIIPVSRLLHRDPVTIAPSATIREAAELMTTNRVSSLLVTENDALVGIVTDRDIRSRCVAAGLSRSRPVAEIMTANVTTVDSHTPAFRAMMTMSQEHCHHLPVVDQGRILGMVSTTDLMRHESTNAVYLADSIEKAGSVDELARLSLRLPALQMQIVSSGGTAEHVGEAVTTITDTFTRKLLRMAEEKLGPPPVAYAWVAGGSQARREQSSHSDQDNGLIIGDEMTPADGEYFEALARFVNDGLDACGYVYCPGDVMASNPKWRQTRAGWSAYFQKWIWQPEPMALMLSSIFFDLRVIHGEQALLDEVYAKVHDSASKNRIFLAYMASNALKYRPPLGFIRDFVLIHDGEHNNTVDLKHSGTVPVVDLARLYALAEGNAAINTIERLQQCAGSRSVSREAAENLIDAFEFINTLRIQHQAEQIRRGEKPDNFLAPSALSKLEREHLKDAFKAIRDIQEAVGARFQSTRFA